MGIWHHNNNWACYSGNKIEDTKEEANMKGCKKHKGWYFGFNWPKFYNKNKAVYNAEGKV